MKENIRLSKPYVGNKRKLMGLIREVLKSGYLVQGKYVGRFEQEVAGYLGVKHAIAVSSGTAALHLSLMASGVGPGDEVIVPAYTFPATVNVIELVGAKPVLVEVDLDTYNIQVEHISEAISPKTKAIIPVHIFGNPVDMHPIIEIAEKYNLVVIEDAAGALGSVYMGKKCGTIGNLGCFSFHPRKVITTGEGGMVVTDDEHFAEQIRHLRNHGSRAIGLRHEFIAPGLNYRMNELEAALGITQMSEIEKIITKRERIAKSYKELLKEIPYICCQKIWQNCRNNWQAFVIRLKDRNDKNIFSAIEVLKNGNIEANIGAYAIHMLPFYSRKYEYRPLDHPNAKELYEKALALPFYIGMNREKMIRVSGKIRELLR